MFTPNRALRVSITIILFLSITLTLGGAIYAQTIAIDNALIDDGQGILAGSGPTEVLGLDIVSDATQIYRLETVDFVVWNVGVVDEDGLNETTRSDFATVEIWRDNDVDELTRSGVFDPPGGLSPDADFLIVSQAADLASPAKIVERKVSAEDVVSGVFFSIIVPPVGLAEAPSDNAVPYVGSDFFLVIRTSQTIDSDPFDPIVDNIDRVDDFFISVEALGITVTGGGASFSFPAENSPDVETGTIRAEVLALDLRPMPSDRTNRATFENLHPGNDFDEPPVGFERYEYGIMGQNMRQRFLGERDVDFSGTDTDTFEAFYPAIGFEEPVVEVLERRQEVIGLDIAGGTSDNPEFLGGITLTFTNDGLLPPSSIEFKPDLDLDEFWLDRFLTPDEKFFSGITVYTDSNGNGEYDEPVLDEFFSFDPASGDQPVDIIKSGSLRPIYSRNGSITHYMLRLFFDDPAPIELFADETTDYFVVMRPDSGQYDDSNVWGDGTAVSYGADFFVSMERTEDADLDGAIDPGLSDFNLDGLAQTPPAIFQFANPQDRLSLLAAPSGSLFTTRELGAVVKGQDLAYDWGFDEPNFPPVVRIPQRIDATSTPTALLGINAASSDVPQLNLIDQPLTLTELRLNFSGIGFDTADIDEIMLARDDKSPFQEIANSVGVFDLFNDLLNQPLPGGDSNDRMNPEEESPVPLRPLVWGNDGATDFVVMTPLIPPRIYSHDNVELPDSIGIFTDNFEMIDNPTFPGEQIPRDIVFAGADYFVAITTSDTISYGDEIRVEVPYGGLSFSNGPSVFQTTEDVFHPDEPRNPFPISDFRSVFANVPVKLTNLVWPSQSIGANSGYTAVIGLNMFTNQPPAAQGGVDVYFEQLMIAFLQFGTRDTINLADDFLPFENVNGANTVNSGVQIYRDANGNGVFDGPTTDILVNMDSIPNLGDNPARVGLAGDEFNQVLMIFSSDLNRQLVPPTDTSTDAGDDFFLVLRTSPTFNAIEDNFSVAIISWGPDSPAAPAPHTVQAQGDTEIDALNLFQRYPFTRRGIGFVDSNGIRTRSNEQINTEVLNAYIATQLEGVAGLIAEFEVGSAFNEVTIKWVDTNGNEVTPGVINEPDEDGYIVETEMFGVWLPSTGSPYPPGTEAVTLIYPTSFAGETVKVRVYPYKSSLLPTTVPPFNGPGPMVEISVTLGTSPLPTGEGGGGGGGCFIATAAYGTDSAKDVLVLREFRDSLLLDNAAGRAFVKLYYTLSPPVASFIAERPILRRVVRTGLAPAVAFASTSMAATPAERSFLWLIFAVLLLSTLVPLARKIARNAWRSDIE